MTTKIQQLLTEAKAFGGHAAAKNPWRHHAISATIRAAVSPAKHQARLDVGQRVVYPRFARLEAQFRRDLDDIFNNMSAYTVRRVKRLFRIAYTAAFQLGQLAATGSGSNRLPPLKPEDKRWLETFLQKEFKLWKKFMADVEAGKGKLDYDKRKEMYVQALQSMYNTSRVIATPPMTLYYWETTPAEHCPHCLYLQRMSPFIKENLPAVPAAGDTKCLSNCKCHLRIEHVSVVQYMKVKRGAPSREQILRGMRATSK
jgi:hypothetical protein